MDSRNSTPAGESSAHQRFKPTNAFSIISRTKDAYSFKKRYLTGPEWDSVHIIPDEPYNNKHKFSHYVAFCKSKDILDSAFLRLRLQAVTVHKTVHNQTLKDVNPVLRRLHGAEISSAIVTHSSTSSPSLQSREGESRASPPTAQQHTLAGTAYPPGSQSSSTPTSLSHAETSQQAGNDIHRTWKQDTSVSPDLALAVATSTTSNDVDLPRTWSIKSRLPEIKEGDFVSASRAETLYLERKAKLEDLFNKPRAELEARRGEMRARRK